MKLEILQFCMKVGPSPFLHISARVTVFCVQTLLSHPAPCSWSMRAAPTFLMNFVLILRENIREGDATQTDKTITENCTRKSDYP